MRQGKAMERIVTVLLGSLLLLCFVVNAKSSIPAVFTFGDSTMDVGNNLYINGSAQANHLPYGKDFIPASGRWSNGRLAGDYVAAYLGLPIAPPILKPGASFQYGANFASAGSGVLVTTGVKDVTLRRQLAYFTALKKGASRHKLTPKIFEEAFYLLSTGTNDYFPVIGSSNATVITETITAVVGGLAKAIQDLYVAGARKFLIIPVPPLGCLPALLAALGGPVNGKCSGLLNQISSGHNAALEAAIIKLRVALPGASILFAKGISNLIQKIAEDPQHEGYRSGLSACCGGGLLAGQLLCGSPPTTISGKVVRSHTCHASGKYVFWDSVHLTQRSYKRIAKNVYLGDTAFVTPINLKQLAAKP